MVWPFKSKVPPRLPEVHIDGKKIVFVSRWNQWEFDHGELGDEYECTYSGKVFDVNVIPKLDQAIGWIAANDSAIADSIAKHMDIPVSQAKSVKRIVSVEVSELISDGKIDISLCGDDSWADFGVNIVIKDGSIIDSYAGD